MKTVYNTKLILIRGLLIIFLLNIFIPSSAQFEATILEVDSISNIDNNYTEILEYGSSIEDKAPDFRIPSEKKIEKFQNDKRFQYESKAPTPTWLNKLKDNIKGIFGYLLIIAIVGLIVFVILKLKGFRRHKLNTSPISIYSDNVPEDVHKMDFDMLIGNALKNKDYRLVVRFMYLKNLKKLTDNGIINWNINKTNYSYLQEIKDNDLRSKFLDTTFIFDYVWYGEFMINELNFSKAYDVLNQFNKMIGK